MTIYKVVYMLHVLAIPAQCTYLICAPQHLVLQTPENCVLLNKTTRQYTTQLMFIFLIGGSVKSKRADQLFVS